jgi:hypothetical protein
VEFMDDAEVDTNPKEFGGEIETASGDRGKDG